MKQFHIYPLLLLALAMTSCSTYQYSARQTDVRQRPIDATEQMAGLTVNYDRQVTATSDYQLTKRDAINEAEFRCIQESKIDVVVDPMFKVEYNPFKLKKRYKATIIGFAGDYKEASTRIDDSKKYTLEEIEKYKLLYDPNFPQHYYQKSQIGDSFIFNGGYGSPAPKKDGKPTSLLMQKETANPAMPADPFAIRKALRLRNAGIGTLVGGTVLCMVVGLPMLLTSTSDSGVIAGAVFMGLGAGAAVYAGIPLLSVGQTRYNHLKGDNAPVVLSLNRSTNGIGLGLTF